MKTPQLTQNQPNQENQPNQPQPLHLLIDSKLIDAVLTTLAQLPYGQIEPLMTALRNDLAKNNPLQ